MSANLPTAEPPLSQRTSVSPTALPEELLYLITSFLPSQSSDHRATAYVTLAKYCQDVRTSFTVKGKQPDPATGALTRIFSSALLSHLRETDEQDLLAGVSFLAALFQVDWDSASAVFQSDGVLDFVMDSVDLPTIHELPTEVAHLIAQACGHKSCRAILTPQTTQWLEAQARQTQNSRLRAEAAVALVKLLKGNTADASSVAGSEDDTLTTHNKEEELASLLRRMVISSDDRSVLGEAIEGIAYLSTDSVIKDALASDSIFLKQLFSVVPRKKGAGDLSSTVLYGVFVIVSNLCAYRPMLTEEQTQMERLKKMAKPRDGHAQSLDEAKDDSVRSRAKKLVASGVLEIFPAATSALDSVAIRACVGKALLGIVTDKENRGKVLQSGGASLLSRIIKFGLPPSTAKIADMDPMYLEPIQALAKLAITAAPVQVFGPNTGAVLDAIRPFSILLQHPSSNLLQRFEAIMALTNLAGQSPDVTSRIASSNGLLNKIELLLLEEQVMVRRASMELVCNLIAGCEDVFERYGGTGYDASSAPVSKLQILLALSDVDDLATRTAASGALATVTAAPSACAGLLKLHEDRRRVFPILVALIDPSAEDYDKDAGLIHRGVVCIQNLFNNIPDQQKRVEMAKEAKESGLLQALANVLRSPPDPSIQQLVARALKSIIDTKA